MATPNRADMAEAINFQSSNATFETTGPELGPYNGLDGVNATDPFPTATPEPRNFEPPANIQVSCHEQSLHFMQTFPLGYNCRTSELIIVLIRPYDILLTGGAAMSNIDPHVRYVWGTCICSHNFKYDCMLHCP